MNDPLFHQLRVLKLPGIRENLESRLLEANANNLSYEDFLSMLLTDEVNERASRRVKRLLRQATLGTEATLETFSFEFNPQINAKLIKGLASCRYLERGEGIILLGPTGTGKTHLAKALCHQACRMMHTAVFYNKFKKFLADLALADLENRLSTLMKRLLKVDLIALDGFGLSSIDQISAERFYTVVDGRFRSKSIVLTSNRAITDWPDIFPDPVMAGAILDRLAHTSHQITLQGQSYRKNLRVDPEEW